MRAANALCPRSFSTICTLPLEESRAVRPRPIGESTPRPRAAIAAPALLDYLRDRTRQANAQRTRIVFAMRVSVFRIAHVASEDRAEAARAAANENYLLQGNIVHDVLAAGYARARIASSAVRGGIRAGARRAANIPNGYHTERLRNAMREDLLAVRGRCGVAARASSNRAPKRSLSSPFDGLARKSPAASTAWTSAADGNAYVIDYKYSAAQRTKGRLKDENLLQAPLYIMAAKEAFGVEPDGVFYVGLKRRRGIRGLEPQRLSRKQPDSRGLAGESRARARCRLRSRSAPAAWKWRLRTRQLPLLRLPRHLPRDDPHTPRDGRAATDCVGVGGRMSATPLHRRRNSTPSIFRSAIWTRAWSPVPVPARPRFWWNISRVWWKRASIRCAFSRSRSPKRPPATCANKLARAVRRRRRSSRANWSAPGSSPFTDFARGCCARKRYGRASIPNSPSPTSANRCACSSESMGAAMEEVFRSDAAAVRALIRGLSSPEFEEQVLSAYDAMRGAGMTDRGGRGAVRRRTALAPRMIEAADRSSARRSRSPAGTIKQKQHLDEILGIAPRASSQRTRRAKRCVELEAFPLKLDKCKAATRGLRPGQSSSRTTD